MTGTVLGSAVSLFLATLVIWLFGLFGTPAAVVDAPYAWVMLFVVFLRLQATGHVCAFRSPGDTSYESAIAGLIALSSC